jgi:hypothetical protein
MLVLACMDIWAAGSCKMYHGRALPDYIVTGDGWRLFVGLSVHLV